MCKWTVCRHLYSVHPLNTFLHHTVNSGCAAIATTSCNSASTLACVYIMLCSDVLILCAHVFFLHPFKYAMVMSARPPVALFPFCTGARRSDTASMLCTALLWSREAAARSRTISLALFNLNISSSPQRRFTCPALKMPHYDLSQFQVVFAEATLPPDCFNEHFVKFTVADS